MSLSLSLIVPTRERAAYLPHCVRTCTENPQAQLEILVLDNASTDDTPQVAAAFRDSRIRYVRNDVRLSMRDNFEKGLALARGDIVCFVGDDDGVFPFSVERVLGIFEEHNVDAVAAARAHYFWPDLVSPRRNTALLPRKAGVTVFDSRAALRHVLSDNDYYRLPCLYHGFVKRSVVEGIARRQGRFFLSSMVDIYSSIALSMENLRVAFSYSPLVINGGSARSNGASHFGGGTAKEKSLWRKEDDLGFLPGFDGTLTIGGLIIESALRYCNGAGSVRLPDLLDLSECVRALDIERSSRLSAGRSQEDSERPFVTAGLADHLPRQTRKTPPRSSRAARLLRSFMRNCPVDMKALGVVNVHEAAQELGRMTVQNRAGLFSNPVNQLKAATRIARS